MYNLLSGSSSLHHQPIWIPFRSELTNSVLSFWVYVDMSAHKWIKIGPTCPLVFYIFFTENYLTHFSMLVAYVSPSLFPNNYFIMWLYRNLWPALLLMDSLVNSKLLPLKIIPQRVYNCHGVVALWDCSLKGASRHFFGLPKRHPSPHLFLANRIDLVRGAPQHLLSQTKFWLE